MPARFKEDTIAFVSLKVPFRYIYILGFCASLLCFGCESNNQSTPIESPKEDLPIADTLSIAKEIEYQPDSLQLIKAYSIDTFFGNKFKNGLFNGVVLFAESGNTYYKKAFGYADFETKDTLTIQHNFQLASVSKPLTAMAILKLHQYGFLDIQDSIQTYLPSFPYDGITVEMLLCHRSGLSNYMYFCDEHWHDFEQSISNNEVLDIMEWHQPMYYYKPDKQFNYCNTNYAVLASIIEVASGMTYSNFMQKVIFKPIGMNDTYVATDSLHKAQKNKAIGHNRYTEKAEDIYLNGVVGDKGIYTTIDDLLKFDDALNNEEIIADSLLQMAFEPHNDELNGLRNYGLGWRILKLSDTENLIFHKGWWMGYRTYYIKRLQTDTTIIIFTNTTKGGYLNVYQLLQLAE